MIALIFLCLAIGCYSVSQLQQHGKLKWMDDDKPYSFWGEKSDIRKYKRTAGGVAVYEAKDNWYTRIMGIDNKEAWFTSTNLTSFLTDGYHFAQWMAGNFISLSSGIALELNWGLIAVVWLLVHLVHFGVYRLLQK